MVETKNKKMLSEKDIKDFERNNDLGKEPIFILIIVVFITLLIMFFALTF
jgi:hypothetical protein